MADRIWLITGRRPGSGAPEETTERELRDLSQWEAAGRDTALDS